MRKIQFASYPKSIETTISNRSVSDYIWSIAQHAIPIVGSILLYNNLSCAYPSSAKKPSLEETVSVQEEKSVEERMPQIQQLTLQDLIQINPFIEGRYATTLEYAAAIESAEKRYNIPPGLFAGLIMHESKGNTYAVSPVGAAGLSQLMPVTANELGAKVWYGLGGIPMKSTRYGHNLLELVKKHKKKTKELTRIDERFIPEKNIELGARYLRQLYDRLGDWDLALKAYNLGPNHREFHKIHSTYPRTVRKYQKYWSERNRASQELAYSSSNTANKL